MRDNPDSALAIVSAVNIDSLTDEGNHAYRDLLLTQARYKCYIVATTDSDINRALNYYRRHDSEREKLTRAYIYKGTVMEELGYPDSAMLYYKQAEAAAAPTDYFNLGYIKMQIGDLYINHYAIDGKGIEKYEDGIQYIKLTNDTDYLFKVTNNLGCLYRETNPKKADSILLVASRLAHHMDNQLYIAYNIYSRIVLYFHLQQYDKARRLMRNIPDSSKYILGYNFYFSCANVYARCGVLDSAFHYYQLGQQHKLDDEQYGMYSLGCLSELALANKDTISHLKYFKESERIADSLKSNKEKIELLDIETGFDKESIKKEREKSKLVRARLISILVLGFLVAGFIQYRRKHHYDYLIKTIRQKNFDHLSDLSELRQRINELQIQDEQLKDFIISHNNMMREVIDACYHEPRNSFANRVKQIVKYQDENLSLWERLYDYLDIEYNNIMKRTTEDYPQLNDKDRLLIALTCLNFSYIEISMILGYSNATTIGGNKQRVAKKMKLTYSLNDYVKQFQTNHNQ